MGILVTYFEPFGGESINASAQAAALLPRAVCGKALTTLELPVVFGAAGTRLTEALRQYQPELTLCLGQAEGSAALHLERVAINLQDASRPDNGGNTPQEEPICPDGPAAYFTALPVKQLAQSLRDSGIPAQVSNSAGTYVCNNVMYALLHWLSQSAPGAKGGFIHVPLTPEQAASRSGTVPSLDAGIAARGLVTIMELMLGDG